MVGPSPRTMMLNFACHQINPFGRSSGMLNGIGRTASSVVSENSKPLMRTVDWPTTLELSSTSELERSVFSPRLPLPPRPSNASCGVRWFYRGPGLIIAAPRIRRPWQLYRNGCTFASIFQRGPVMSRNSVICFDGTNNKFGPQNTNVVRLVQSLLRDPSRQGLYYDPGVGTLPEPGVWNQAWEAYLRDMRIGVWCWSDVESRAGVQLADGFMAARRSRVPLWLQSRSVFSPAAGGIASCARPASAGRTQYASLRYEAIPRFAKKTILGPTIAFPIPA